MERRDFLKGAAAMAAAPALVAQKKLNDTICVGTRGYYLFQEFQGVETRSICDLYDGNLKLDRAVAILTRVARRMAIPPA